MNLETTELINICFLPDEETSNRCIQLSQSMASDDTIFSLGDGLFPHLTIYMVRFPRDVREAVLDRLDTVVSTAKQPLFLHTGYLLTEARYFEASFQKTSALLALQEQLAAALSPLRYQPTEPEAEAYYENWRVHTRENVRRTGYNLMGDLYRPHISLTRFIDGRVPSAIDDPTPPDTLNFRPSHLGAYLANDQGAIHTALQRFDFSSPSDHPE